VSGFQLRRIGQIMEPEPGNPHEVEGVLNPAAVRGPDGALYLFPRLVARGNDSRIGIARVLSNDDGDPTGVERLGIALEPDADYELRADGSGGCEDPRRDDLGLPDRFDVYYGMADSRIGVARLDLPDYLPPGAPADPPSAAVKERDCCAQEQY